MADDQVQNILDRLEDLKDEVEAAFKGLGLGRDQVGRAHDALDVAKAAIASHHPAISTPVVEAPTPEPTPEPVVDPQPEPVVAPPEPAPVAPVAPPVLDTPAQ